MLELLLGPTGAYVLILLGFVGIVFLIVSAVRGKFKDILTSFAVVVGAFVLGVITQAEVLAAVSALGFFAMVAFGIRRLFHKRNMSLLIGVLCAGGAVAVFIFRAIMASLFAKG